MKIAAHSKKKIKDNLVQYAIYGTIVFIIISVVLSFWNRHVTYQTRSAMVTADHARAMSAAIGRTMLRDVDTGVRAFMLSKDETLLTGYTDAIKSRDSVFRTLEASLITLNLPLERFYVARNEVYAFLKTEANAVKYVQKGIPVNSGSSQQKFEHATAVTALYVNEITPLLEESAAHALSDYEWSITDNAIIQIILILLSVPILIVASRKLQAEIDQRRVLLTDLGESNRTYLYNRGIEANESVNTVIQDAIAGLKKAYVFVEQVSKGDYSQTESLIAENAVSLNKQTLMGALRRMSVRLQKAELDERNRAWRNEGLNDFYQLVRKNSENLQALADAAASFLTRYVSAQQGALFLLDEDHHEPALKLLSCYAFERRKWHVKSIGIGEGIVGQAFLEADITLMTDLPAGYIHITSGLGHATPSCLLVAPLRYDGVAFGVLEVAGFERFSDHHVEFIKRACEFFASTLQTLKNQKEIQRLLDNANGQADVRW